MEPSDYALLLFRVQRNGCVDSVPLWIRVTGRSGSQYIGALDGDESLVAIEMGERVTFDAKHVVATHTIDELIRNALSDDGHPSGMQAT
jgi:hypothetical protein